MDPDSCSRKLVGIVLVLVIAFVHGIGLSQTIGVEHDHHHDDESHGHCWLELMFGCRHHSDHEPHHPADSPCESNGCEDSSHTHVIGISSIGPMMNWNAGSSLVPPGAEKLPHRHGPQRCPDGPSFDLLKPPQLS